MTGSGGAGSGGAGSGDTLLDAVGQPECQPLWAARLGTDRLLEPAPLAVHALQEIRDIRLPMIRQVWEECLAAEPRIRHLVHARAHDVVSQARAEPCIGRHQIARERQQYVVPNLWERRL